MIVEAANVLVAVIHDSAVVTGENNQRLLGELQPLEFAQHLSDGVVQLGDGVASRANGARAAKARVRHAWHVDAVRRQIEEERAALIAFNKRLGLGSER